MNAADTTVRAADLSFILDKPAAEDNLAHAPVAGAIADVVRNQNTIKMIGLIGRWGSGKSTVVEMAKAILEEKDEDGVSLRCFTFDAWRHQSDPPRLAFLAALAQYLQKDEAFTDMRPLKSEETPPWRASFDDLQVQSEKTTTRTTPTLTAPGKWLGASLVLAVPLGLKLIGDGTLGGDDQRDNAAFAVFVLAWCAALAPAIVLAWFYLWWRRWSELGQSMRNWSLFRDWLTRHRDRNRDDVVLSVVSNQKVDLRTEVRRRSRDPSAIEFQVAFRDMIAAAHKAGGRRLVIIVDNLDRLPADEAKIFWSTVRALFLGGDDAHAIRREDLPTVLMPIDATSVDKMYGGLIAGAGTNEDLSRSFLEKTFDLVFHVPPPVLSRWHGYLNRKLKDVFGDRMEADWPTLIGSIYERSLADVPATPREINSFVNAIAVLWLQRSANPIHITIVAYYVTIRATIVDQNTIRNLYNEDLHAMDPEWRTALAALHYGLSCDDAEELLLERPIWTALTTGDNDEFEKLYARSGFDRYFLRVLSSADGRVVPALAAAALLSRQFSQPWLGEAQRRLRLLSVKDEPPAPLTPLDAEGVRWLHQSADSTAGSRYLEDLAKVVSAQTEAALVGDGLQLWLNIVIAMSEAAVMTETRLQISPPGGAATLARVLGRDVPQSALNTLGLDPAEASAVVVVLSGWLDNPKSASTVPGRIRHLLGLNLQDVNWTPWQVALEAALTSGDGARARAALTGLTASYAKVKAIRDQEKAWRDGGVLQQAFSAAWPEAKLEHVAAQTAIAAVYNLSPATGLAPPWAERVTQWPELPERSAAALREMGKTFNLRGILGWASEARPDKSLWQAVSQHLIDEGYVAELKLDGVFEDALDYVTLEPSSLQTALFNGLSERSEFWKQLKLQPAKVQRPLMVAMMQRLTNKIRLGKAVQAHLKTVTGEEWRGAIFDGATPWDLFSAIDLHMPQSQASVGDRAFSVLREAIPGILDGSDDLARSRWASLAARLGPTYQVTLFKSFAGSLSKLSGRILELIRVLDQNGSPLFAQMEANADRTVVDVVLPLAASAEGREWLKTHIAEIRPWVVGAEPESRDTLTAVLIAEMADSAALVLTEGLRLKHTAPDAASR